MYKVGEKYLVDVAICKDTVANKTVVIPIQPLKHRDAAFGVEWFHYHLDCRFKMSKYVMQEFSVENNHTNVPLWSDHQDMPSHFIQFQIIELTKKKLLCVSDITGLNNKGLIKTTYTTQKKIGLYWKWYKSMVGKSCAGKKCPHYGTEMIDNGKHLVCPMHNLMGDRKTEKIIPFKKQK